MRTSDVYLKGLGVFLPQTVSVEQAVRRGLYPRDEVEAHDLGGAAVAGMISAPEMALAAAQEAFKRCGQRPEDTDLILYADSWHQGPDGWQPQFFIQRNLGCDRALGIEIRQGCNGMFGALELAASYLRADGERESALLVASDNFGTPLIDRWRTGAGFVLGDAACAVLLGREPGFAQLLSVCTTTVPEAEEVHRSGEALFPPGCLVGRDLDLAGRGESFNAKAMAETGSTAVWDRVYQTVPDVIGRNLAEAGITIDDVSRIAVMNFSREIIENRYLAMLGLPLSRSTWDFGRTVGHIGASDQVVSLDHLLTTGEIGAGDHVLLFGLGPGMTACSAVVKILHRPSWLG
ncbi:ketoacyl-ACP synthase III family protein [Micromonospora sp. WMMD712]|uniref:ketoacyl-ACP synthase III family protein n=1 Tax=Micromonospora sp. WMMD712 TaxID=3016096 RepID=UPI00249AC618|nr:ketoacyl-ACP synthase III family protein [Micromonospora sp. WMMD712]WFE56847.1 ketoacyl-ACP synthase III family protein [Micromonospora sp. WMMD712]